MLRTHRRRRCALTVSISLGLVAVAFTASSASAVESARQTRPVVAGSQLEFEFGGDCTAGAVVQKNTWSSLLVAKERATRYVVTANHCVARTGEKVYVRNEIESRHGNTAPVGTVYWRSDDIDLALIKIEPTVHVSYTCGSSSHGAPHCLPVTTWTPNALPRVLTASVRTRSIYGQPVIGYSDPGPNETFATSGSTTGVQVNWMNLSVRAWPPGFRAPHNGDQAASSTTDLLLAGDSGGPVFNPDTGMLYGIMTDQVPRRLTEDSTMVYIKLYEFFKEQRGYKLLTR
ncbi:trypsin-like peptidase domain-containing protein (plasmid) [Clavibacter capsici]|uniref:Trypsin-like peptidase domain-containing protein n=1 Tax=Clavibacter capsici TaxID=1874630 RepID=A0AAE6XU36_9MICO|nr:trypsin-like peptidase domain-containing protein [Clavibacter capsici]QIS40556.1 trypsin-like peptidase domain-containing protein [Clavibacter capsici]QIS43512.1 trypsin-like peptidase domain-containing protein [Clavibacter capsici]QIS46441.1 trypsin-like peptidase domain-containing protein [Clavibacter capsici]